VKLGVLRRAVAGYFANDCPLAAAAISYYVLLSVFPLLLLAIALGTVFLPQAQMERALVEFLNQYAAGSSGTVRRMVHGLAEHRTSFGILALVGIVWSGLGVFGALRTALNLAWGIRETRSFWRQRQLEVFFALSIGLLFLLSSLLTWGMGLLAPAHDDLVGLTRLVVGAAVAFLAFFLCYEVLPNDRHRHWRTNLWTAGAMTVLFEAAKYLFLEYLRYFANYSIVYGALAAVVVFLVWAYATASILLFGGQLAREVEASVGSPRTRGA
jgi:membrane protein